MESTLDQAIMFLNDFGISLIFLTAAIMVWLSMGD
tara:strand:+ start:563 stop:667 length:105 start_codon:yes stop_codon:yes gene_type:complete